MGRMKKLYELAGDGTDQAAHYFIVRNAYYRAVSERVLEAIRTAEFLIGDFLEEGYTADIQAARQLLKDSITLLEGPHDHAKGTSQGQHRATQD